MLITEGDFLINCLGIFIYSRGSNVQRGRYNFSERKDSC